MGKPGLDDPLHYLSVTLLSCFVIIMTNSPALQAIVKGLALVILICAVVAYLTSSNCALPKSGAFTCHSDSPFRICFDVHV